MAIRPREGVLTMETMLFGDEVVSPDDAGRAARLEEAKATKKEVDMARQLIDSLSADFDPDKYRDEYRDAVLEMIERKAEGQEIAVQEAPEEPDEVPDLMAALEASIAGAKRQGEPVEGAADEAQGQGEVQGRQERLEVRRLEAEVQEPRLDRQEVGGGQGRRGRGRGPPAAPLQPRQGALPRGRASPRGR